MSEETWRISENPPDGLNPFRFRLLGGEGRETRPIAMFMHLTDIENTVSDHQQAQEVAALIDLLTVARSWTGLGSKGHPFQRLVGFKAVGEWSAKVDKALAAISGKETT